LQVGARAKRTIPQGGLARERAGVLDSSTINTMGVKKKKTMEKGSRTSDKKGKLPAASGSKVSGEQDRKVSRVVECIG